MTHNAGFEKGQRLPKVVGFVESEDGINWEPVPNLLPDPNEIWETRQVMLHQGKKIKALELKMKLLSEEIDKLRREM